MNKHHCSYKKNLTSLQIKILSEHVTEAPGTSQLLYEKRIGLYCCVGCSTPLFKSEFKFDSGTGWPSFYQSIQENLSFTTDNKFSYPRTEYHCKTCKGHQGHLFHDGPEPTGLRYCNNGTTLEFIEESNNTKNSNE